uniref:Uncharacterized protein n=1 Tax=Arundo donax TaxID=35708 RepID=A0A0A9A4K5_ARUDO
MIACISCCSFVTAFFNYLYRFLSSLWGHSSF